MSDGTIEIYVGETSGMEARVFARYESAAGPELVEIRGTLRGPFCERARTLPAEFVFRDLGRQQPGLAEAVVTDPCWWTEELPHLYQADVEAVRGGEVVAAFHGQVGLRGASRNQAD
jgi:hypothetical protein